MSEETMSDESTEAPQEEAKGLRKQLNEAHAELATYKDRDKRDAFSQVGLDPDTGLGKAIFKEYKGDLTAEAVGEFATSEYGYEKPVAVEENPLAPAIAEAQARLDNVNTVAESIVPPTQQGAIAAAEADGDYGTAMELKAQQLAALKGR